jgi:hypothetical protein
MYGSPRLVEPRSNTRTIAGWVSIAAARASRRNRSTTDRERSSGRSTLMATLDSRTMFSAIHTEPIAPSPAVRRRRYLFPMSSPGAHASSGARSRVEGMDMAGYLFASRPSWPGRAQRGRRASFFRRVGRAGQARGGPTAQTTERPRIS